jgi:FkbM family methyltransferase
VQHSGRCIAFEPNPNVARLLRQSLSVNGFDGRSEVREVALSGDEGTSYFYLPHNEPKNARLVPQIDQGAIEQNLGVFISVPTMTLDQAAPERVDFIKIDAEGAEGAIIRGMMGLLRRDRPQMVIEYNCARMADPRSPLEDLLSVYQEIQFLEMDGQVYNTTIDQVLSERVGQDWLLVLCS